MILSQKGWIRAVKGHLADDAEQKFKEGDALRLLLPCETTDRLCLFATNGRVYTLRAADLPRGRGDGQPMRLLVEMANEDELVSLFVPREGWALSGGVGDRARSFLVQGRGSGRPRSAPASRS